MLMMSLCYFAAAPVLLTFTWAASFGWIVAAIFVYSLFNGMGYVNSQPLILPVCARTAAFDSYWPDEHVGLFCRRWRGAAGRLKHDYGLASSFATMSIIVFCIALFLLVCYRLVLPNTWRC